MKLTWNFQRAKEQRVRMSENRRQKGSCDNQQYPFTPCNQPEFRSRGETESSPPISDAQKSYNREQKEETCPALNLQKLSTYSRWHRQRMASLISGVSLETNTYTHALQQLQRSWERVVAFNHHQSVRRTCLVARMSGSTAPINVDKRGWHLTGHLPEAGPHIHS